MIADHEQLDCQIVHIAPSRQAVVAVTGVLFVLSLVGYAGAADRWESDRQKLVDEILIPAGIQHSGVLEVIRKTPRHEFIPRNLRAQAYFDMALPIGEEQTISSPFIVAFMTECLDPQPTDRILEIGTGSGYQAAVLSPLVDSVYTIEIIETLGRRAARTLRDLRYENVHTRVGDGFQGWPEQAPFDKIIVTCSPEQVPQPLVEQLRDGGRMVIPVGERYQQTMVLLRKEDGKLIQEKLRPTLFVPMTGKAEEQRAVQPDPANPSLINSSFELPSKAEPTGQFIEGWYYQRQAEIKTGDDAPDGECYVEFANELRGRDSHLLQGLAIDARQVSRINLSCWIRANQVVPGPHTNDQPRVVIMFYDEQRRELGMAWLGPWVGDIPWRQESRSVRVPAQTREAIVRLGLFGATGRVAFDAVQITPQR